MYKLDMTPKEYVCMIMWNPIASHACHTINEECHPTEHYVTSSKSPTTRHSIAKSTFNLQCSIEAHSQIDSPRFTRKSIRLGNGLHDTYTHMLPHQEIYILMRRSIHRIDQESFYTNIKEFNILLDLIIATLSI